MAKPSNSSKKRLLIIFAITAFVSLALILRLGYLQVVKGEELKKGAIGQWTKGVTIKSKRGIIYDRNGRKLAVSVSSSTVWANPDEIKTGDPDEIAEEVARVLDIEKDEVYEKMTRDKRAVRIKQWISPQQAKELRKLKLTGISLVDDNRRSYPNKNFASHILGFTDIDNNGIYGIEKTYDKYLAGTPGKWIKTTDAPGRQLPFDGEKIYDPADGLSLVLTIDQTIQNEAEEAAQESFELNEAKHVSVIVMDPKTGDILAMAGKPDYDPNDPRLPVDKATKKKWSKLSSEKLQEEWNESWRNFAINDIYEPGSTFKLITAAAALEENAVTLETHLYCDGVKCSKNHGSQTFIEAMNNSCNAAFVDVGASLGKDLFYKYIKAFGFGEKTNINLNGEQRGIIPISSDVIKDVNLATISYGYGVALTPMQLITAVSSFANGGNLMEPRIVKELVDEEGIVREKFEPVIKRQVLSEKTASTMLTMMGNVVSDGTGSNGYIPGFRVGGKTGTAQKLVDGIYAQGKHMASFIAVAPVDDPQVAILVVIDEPSTGQFYGGSIAAPVVKDVLTETLKYLEVEPKFTDEEKQEVIEKVIVPDVKDMEMKKAGKDLNSIGLKYTTEYLERTDKSKVIDQFPLPGAQVDKGSIVDLYLKQKENPQLQVPYLVRKTKEDTIMILENMDLNYEFKGEGKVVNQNPLPGEEINKDTKIIVEFGEIEE